MDKVFKFDDLKVFARRHLPDVPEWGGEAGGGMVVDYVEETSKQPVQVRHPSVRALRHAARPFRQRSGNQPQALGMAGLSLYPERIEGFPAA